MTDNKLAEVEQAIREVGCLIDRARTDGLVGLPEEIISAHLLPVISRLLDAERDAAHADALRAAAVIEVPPCIYSGIHVHDQQCPHHDLHTYRKNAILALSPKCARLERELEVARAVITVLKEAEDKSVMWIRTRVADLEAKLAALKSKNKT